MSKKVPVIVLLMLCLFNPIEGWADYTIMGSGIASCGTWTAQRRARQSDTFEQWVVGFLAGVGWVGDKGDDPLRGLDAQAVLAWMDNYCQAHPLERIAKATSTFALDHPH